jgi:hypothetical protein
MTAQTTADQGMCPHNSTDTGPIELSGHNRRSAGIQPSRGQAGCGLVSLLRRREDPGAGAIVRLFCKRKRCPDCGPRRCARLKAKYLELLGSWLDANPGCALNTYEIAPAAWASLGRNLRRRDAAYVRIPLTSGADLVVTAEPPGADRPSIADRADLERVLDAAFTWTLSSGFDTRRCSHRGFEAEASAAHDNVTSSGEKPQVKAGAGATGTEPTGWELLGFIGHPYFAAISLADQLDLDPAPVPERELADDWAEAHTIRLPGEGTATWRRMLHRLQVRPPTTRQQDRELREQRRRMANRRPSIQHQLPGVAA